MSAHVYKCPACGKTYEGSREDAGAQFRCETCGTEFVLEKSGESPPTRHRSGFFWFLGIFPKCLHFRGRSRRREYWWAFLFRFLALSIAAFLDGFLDTEGWIVGVSGLVTALPMMSVAVRRLHDTNKSGWWLPLMALAPINIAFFVWLATVGDKGSNRFGPDPKAL